MKLILGLLMAVGFIPLVVACGGSDDDPAPAAPGMPGHAGMNATQTGAPFDATFIDSMIEHHNGAIEMANVALKEGTRPEIRTLAQAIVASQSAEVTQLQSWRKAWYPDLADTGGMGMSMGSMEVSGDSSVPFDRRFIDAMIPHHESAIEMANMALAQSTRPEIKTLAEAIISAQTKEIAEMKTWRKDWYGQ